MSSLSSLDVLAAVEFLSWIPRTLSEAGVDFPPTPYVTSESEAERIDINAGPDSEPEPEDVSVRDERRSSAGAASSNHASITPIPVLTPISGAVGSSGPDNGLLPNAYASLSSATSFDGIDAMAQASHTSSGLLLGEHAASFRSAQSLLSAYMAQSEARATENSSSNNLILRGSQKSLAQDNPLSSNSTPHIKRLKGGVSQKIAVSERKQNTVTYQQPRDFVNHTGYNHIVYVYKKRHPIVISSVICHDQKPKTRPLNNAENEEQIPRMALLPSNVFESDPEQYDPAILDLSEFHIEMNRKQMTQPSYLVSVIQYVNPKTQKQDLNQRFSSRHPEISADFTFSMLKKIFQNMVEICEEKLLGLDAVSLSMIYLERLICQGFVRKSNRKAVACSCIFLAAKFIDDDYDNLKQTLVEISKTYFQTDLNAIFPIEPLVYLQLRFKLKEKDRHIQTHTDRILKEMGYTYEEYTGTKPFAHFDLMDDIDEDAEDSRLLDDIPEES